MAETARPPRRASTSCKFAGGSIWRPPAPRAVSQSLVRVSTPTDRFSDLRDEDNPAWGRFHRPGCLCLKSPIGWVPMKFRLLFEGEIAPRRAAGIEGVHNIRQQLHPQLKAVWDYEPLINLKSG